MDHAEGQLRQARGLGLYPGGDQGERITRERKKSIQLLVKILESSLTTEEMRDDWSEQANLSNNSQEMAATVPRGLH